MADGPSVVPGGMHSTTSTSSFWVQLEHWK
jgi:hypothetical protein